MTMNDVPIVGKTVLVRADYNVPLTSDGRVSDDYRIRRSVATIRKLLDDNCKVVIISHLGRPDGKADPAYSIEPAAVRLAELLGEPVRFVDACIGPKVKMAIKRAPRRSVTMLENLRFHPEEEANDLHFAAQLARDSGATLFIEDGFGVVHRAHASTSAITQCLPSVAGLLLEHEYTTITEAMQHPKRPLVAVLGGAKVSDKIGVIEALVTVADTIIIGGAMANTFLAYHGLSVGKSKVETDQDETIEAIYDAVAAKVGRERSEAFIVLPVDVGIGSSQTSTERRDVAVSAIPADALALDVGPHTTTLIRSIIGRAHTVIWNGTLGLTENPHFAPGSIALAEQLAHDDQTMSLIGGGDTADFAIHWDPARGESFDHVSTGGGASLELMSGKKLPGVEALLDAR